MKKKGQTLSYSGGYSEVLWLAYPIVITMVSRTIITFVDTAMVGRLGTFQMAAVGLAGILTWTMISFFGGFLTCVNTFVAQHYGADQPKIVAVVAWQGLYLAVGSYLLLLLISRLIPYFFDLMKPSVEVQQLGITYAQIRFYGGLGTFISFALSGFLFGIGDTRTPMWIEIFANLINIVFDYLLIFGNFGFPRLEVAGAAISTVISGGIAACIYLLIFLSRKTDLRFQVRTLFKPQLSQIRRLLRTGLPMGVQGMLDVGNFTIFSAMIGRMGNAELAANTAAITLLHTSFMPLIGISLAATTLVGQYIGSGQFHYARKSGYTAIKIGLTYASLMAVIFFTMPNKLLALLTDDPNVVKLGSRILFLAALFQLSDGCGICSSGALKGAGDTLFTMIVGISYGWLLFLPLAYWLGQIYGVSGAWTGATIYIILLGMTYFLRFLSNRWEKIQI